MEKLKDDLQTAPYHASDVFDDIDDMHFFWESLFKQVLDEHLPQKQREVRSKDVPFMTKDNLVPRVLSYPSLSEREKDPGWFWSRGLQNKINSEGGVLCLSILCLVHAMIARFRKSKIDLLTLQL